MAKIKKITKKPLVKVSTYVNVREINWVLLLVMSIIFGWLGVDRFMMGKVGTGILKLITLGGLGAWWLVDLILIATKYQFKNIEYTD
jgi:TM2 domain-containing membrane protein YozV